MGQQFGIANPPRILARASYRLHLCRVFGGTWFCRRVGGAAVILHRVDAFDPERANSTRSCWHVYSHGCSRSFDLSYTGQHWHGGRIYAGHRNTFALNELRRVIGLVYVSCAGDGYERPHASLRELKQNRIELCPRRHGCLGREITGALTLREQLTGTGDKAGQDLNEKRRAGHRPPQLSPRSFRNLRSDYDEVN